MPKRTEDDFFSTPKGRLINSALFERDIFTDAKGNEGKAKYNIELAFEPDDVNGEGTEDEPTLEDRLIKYAVDKWGAGAEEDFLEGNIRSPLLNGDALAKRREKKGKVGDAYKGLVVIRAATLYNRHGEEAPGGIQVWDEDLQAIEPVDREKVYNGSYGAARLSIGDYVTTDDEGEERNALMFYLSAYQYQGEGERLFAAADTSTAFAKVGRTKGEKSKRKARKG